MSERYELRWPTSVRPGDTLSDTVIVADHRPSRHDYWGNIDFRTELVNKDDPVLTMYSLNISDADRRWTLEKEPRASPIATLRDSSAH